MIKLRDYQIEARDAVLAEWNKGALNTLLPMSTGTGKTECYLATLTADLGTGRALILAHRQELIYQPRDRIRSHWPELGVPGIVMADQDECAAQVVIATVQTLAVNGRLDRLLSAGPITHLITDEAHHSTAPTYTRIYERLREQNPKLRHLGVTATPRRTDGDPLANVYDSVAYRFGIKEAIQRGALVPFAAIGVQLPVSIADVREVGEGWDDEELGEVLKARNAEEIVVETWEKHAKDRPTMAFTASVAQAYSLAERFREYGYAFEALDGTTPDGERKDLLRRFKDGELQGVINCMVLTEGFDAPHAACLVQVKPTKSDLLYVQMAGRVLRKAPSKHDALILDFVPLEAREMRLAGDLLGKPKEQREKEEKAVDAGVVLGCFGLNSDGEGIDGDPDSVVMTVLDYLSASRLSWTFDGDLASTAIGEKTTLAVIMPDKAALDRLEKAETIRGNGGWKAEYEGPYRKVHFGASYKLYVVQGYSADLLGAYLSWEEVCDVADDFHAEHGLGVLSKKQQRWRRLPATDKQQALLQKFGLWKSGLSRGQAAQAITHHFARKAVQRWLPS